MSKSNPSISSGSSVVSGAMVDHPFGDDGTTPPVGAPAPGGGATPGAPVVPPPAPGTPAPNLGQAVAKAQGLAASNAAVAADPNAVHSVKILGASPKVLGSTGTGALIGMGLGGPPGALIGAGIGFVAEKYQIVGGPFGRMAGWLKSKLVKTT